MRADVRLKPDVHRQLPVGACLVRAGDTAHRLRVIGRSIAAWPAMAWVALFMLAPLGLMLVFSFWRYAQFNLHPDFTLANYKAFFDNPTYLKILGRTVVIATVTTTLTIALAYPLALFLYRQGRVLATVVIVLVTIPFWVNTLVRNFAFYGIFGRTGLINAALTGLGFEPAQLMFTTTAVIVVAVYVFLPYALIPLYASMEKIAPSLVDAASDLGASPWHTFRKIVLPLSRSGLQAAILFVFIPSLGLYLTPAMIGGGRTTMMSNVLVPIVSETMNFALGSAFTFILLCLVIGCILVLGRGLNLDQVYAGGTGKTIARRSQSPAKLWLVGLAVLTLLFLYLPVMLVVLFSFDENIAAGFPLKGFTLRWYRTLISDTIALTAIKNSVVVATFTAVVTVILALPAAYAVVRVRFVGRGLFRTLILIPIIVPEIVLAVGILMLFVWVGMPLSLVAIVLGHVTYALPFVFFVALAQQYGMEKSVEEAAHDLGANGFETFRYVILPLMRPAIGGGAILAFTLSLNDFIINFLLAGTTITLPLFMWGLLRGSLTPELNAVSSILIGGTLIAVMTPVIIVAYQQRQRRLQAPKAATR